MSIRKLTLIGHTVPVPDPQRPIPVLSPTGQPPDPVAPPAGCRYHRAHRLADPEEHPS